MRWEGKNHWNSTNRSYSWDKEIVVVSKTKYGGTSIYAYEYNVSQTNLTQSSSWPELKLCNTN